MGSVSQISQTDRGLTPGSFASDRPSRTAPAERQEPNRGHLSNTYQANVPLTPGGQLVLCGSQGKAKIEAGTRTVGQCLWESLCRTFHFEL